MGSCFVIKNNQIIGVVTDGDIRRALLRGKKLDSSILKVMKKKFIFLKNNYSDRKINELFNSDIKIIPIINNKRNLLDYACNKRFHSIPVSEPSLIGNEINYVLDCVKTGWISSRGK